MYNNNYFDFSRSYILVAASVNISTDEDCPLPADVLADTMISYLVEGYTEFVKVVFLKLPPTSTLSKSASSSDSGLKDWSYGLSIARYQTCVCEIGKVVSFLVRIAKGRHNLINFLK